MVVCMYSSLKDVGCQVTTTTLTLHTTIEMLSELSVARMNGADQRILEARTEALEVSQTLIQTFSIAYNP